MPQNEAAAIDPLAGGSFSRLLFSDVEVDDAITDHRHRHRHHQPDNTTAVGSSRRFTFSADQKPPKMLCFGGDYTNDISAVSLTPQNSSTTTTDDNNNSSSPSSTTNSTTTTSLSSNSNMKRNMIRCDYFQPVVLPVSFTTTGATTTTTPMTTTRRNYKKTRAENTPPASHAKVKKEKLGERIAALQQMVSPYGKTDTASVLHEAFGYIKFLQEQVQVLCSPYLQRPASAHIEGEGKKDLGSRGLCLVPVECTLHVAESNGADLWSPAMVNRPPLHLAQ
ncbi:transcription factor bHLH113-like [Cynara cardunculus var. scolymus]|uniref:BHLH domain-containing protein n=1 Tax=Cynara cardunculus var. scolymus TaxID=59895 RepID=A0A124SHW6_CYNCS|nr:transcription factor bHLH113-like [Cynara cardunculus var. scolymus]KVI10817.1 hypothetical protein Ccrd_010784 [Cynara cardunculus var. scolymus]